MFIEKFVSEGLAHFSYIVGNDNDAFVVDPKRDVDSYIQIAKSNCCRIRFVFETHCNEDYLIGSLELERLTGCKIIHSDRLDFGYGEPSTENDTFDTSGMRVRIIETPGHSPESLSFVLYSSFGKSLLLFLQEMRFFTAMLGARILLAGRRPLNMHLCFMTLCMGSFSLWEMEQQCIPPMEQAQHAAGQWQILQ